MNVMLHLAQNKFRDQWDAMYLDTKPKQTHLEEFKVHNSR